MKKKMQKVKAFLGRVKTKACKVAGKATVAVVAGLGAFGASTARADVTSLQTAATDAITEVGTAIGVILVAGMAITVAFWAYGKLKGALKRN